MKHGSGKVNIAKTFIAKNRHSVVAFQLRPNRKSLRDPQSQSHCIFVSPMRAGQDRRRELSLQGRDPVGRKISESPRSTQAGGALTRRPPSSRLFIPLLDRAEGGREGGKCLSFAHSAVFCTSALSKRQRRRRSGEGNVACLRALTHSSDAANSAAAASVAAAAFPPPPPLTESRALTQDSLKKSRIH